MRLVAGLAVAVAATAMFSSCNEWDGIPNSNRASGSEPTEMAGVLDRCLQIDSNAEFKGSRTTMALTSSSAGTGIGLSCVFKGPGGLDVSFYQYADDAEHRREPLSSIAADATTTRIDDVGDDAYGSEARVYSDGIAPPSSTAAIDFDVGTSRWTGVASGDPDDVEYLGELLTSLARNAAEASEQFGPLRRADVEIAAESRRLLEVDRKALTKILGTGRAPDPEPAVSGDLESAEVSESLSWESDQPERSVSVRLIVGHATPQAYADHLLESEAATGYPPTLDFAPADGLGEGAVASTLTSDNGPPRMALFQYVFERHDRIYAVTVSSCGGSPVTEQEAKSFARAFFAGP